MMKRSLRGFDPEEVRKLSEAMNAGHEADKAALEEEIVRLSAENRELEEAIAREASGARDEWRQSLFEALGEAFLKHAESVHASKSDIRLLDVTLADMDADLQRKQSELAVKLHGKLREGIAGEGSPADAT